MQNKDSLHFVTHLMRLIVTFSCPAFFRKFEGYLHEGYLHAGWFAKARRRFSCCLFSLSLIFRLFMKFVLEKKMLSLI